MIEGAGGRFVNVVLEKQGLLEVFGAGRIVGGVAGDDSPVLDALGGIDRRRQQVLVPRRGQVRPVREYVTGAH